MVITIHRSSKVDPTGGEESGIEVRHLAIIIAYGKLRFGRFNTLELTLHRTKLENE